uniref:beta strand repeat-containing protein n=1 Tax=uncultured Psychrobacter sp. TaxID=259303 RepID=UPI002592F297|nr:hypothetical protein [uncultured Psychrobacter sp.]
MKSNTFNYSLLAVGVAALMGVSTGAMADTPTGGTNGATIDIANTASAQYTVAGTTQNAVSNEVTVRVSEQSAFELLAQDGTDTNSDTVNPEAGQTATFVHTLQNNGNVNDTYTIDVANQNGDDFDYTGYTITYTTNLDNTEQTLTNGGTLDLAPNETATITIVATSDNTARQINDEGVITVTASSAYLKANNAGNTDAYTAQNVDTGITSTPIYAIAKSAATNFASNDTFFDTANPNAYIDYTITIKNEGNAAATAFNIEDTLPAGLVALTTFTPQINGTNVAASNFAFSNQNKTLTVTGQDLAIDGSLTLTFRAVKEDGVTIDSGTALTNYAQVEDDTANDTNANTPDLIDRSDDGTVTGGDTESNYEGNSSLGGDDNTKATVTTRNQTRNLTISADPEKEVPLKSTGNVYNYTITSTSTDVVEAAKRGEVFITVDPTTDNPDISTPRVFVDANNNGVYDGGDTELDLTDNGYDLNQAVPSGLNTNDTVNIGVEVATDGDSGDGVAGDIGNSETMTITVTANNTINGTLPPDAVKTESTTTMEGVILTKEQAVASCTSPGTLSYRQAAITNVEPGQCIYYQITATSTFSDAANAISNLKVSDLTSNWAGKATYTGDANAISSTGSNAGLGTDPNGAEAVTTTFTTLAPGASANLTFSVQINQ